MFTYFRIVILFICSTQLYAGSLLGHIKFKDDNGSRQDPRTLVISLTLQSPNSVNNEENDIHEWVINEICEPYILVVRPRDIVKFRQESKEIRDLLISSRDGLYILSNRHRLQVRDFERKGYYKIQEHFGAGDLGYLVVDNYDYIVRPGKHGLIKLDNLPHGHYEVKIYHSVGERPFKSELKILENETTSLSLNIDRHMLVKGGF